MPDSSGIDKLLQNLHGQFDQLRQSQAAPAPAPTAPPQGGGGLAGGYTAPSYDQMMKQALPTGWQAPPSPVAPPAPPPAAPAPAVEQPAPPSRSEWWAHSGMDANTSAPGDGSWARGGRIGYQTGGAAKPTEAQKHAGNYRKEHLSFHGLPIAIENPKGSTREGCDPNGKKWRCVMPADYGYIKRTEGADGDHLDVFIGPDRGSQMVFVINQNDHETGQFDEHKAMLGYSSERAAVADYVKAFNDGNGHARIKSVEPMSLDAFKHWLKRGRTKTPAKSKTIVEHALAMTRSK
jgi:hypothetical protein